MQSTQYIYFHFEVQLLSSERNLLNMMIPALPSSDNIRVQVKRAQSASLTFMTDLSKKSKMSIPSLVVIGVCALLIVLSVVTQIGSGSTSITSPSESSVYVRLNNNFDAYLNAGLVKSWRHKLRDQCTAAKGESDVTKISANQISGFQMPDLRVPQPRNDNAVRRCNNVVMDFGANIGDTSGHVIDTGMISCDRKDLNAATPKSHFNIETKQFELVDKRNKLTAHLEHLITSQGSDRGPEDYCYYGIEGNPNFTDRLQAIEDHVMSMKPRPIQHMHFFTESVGTGEDGMTKLYLDTVNTKQNFWGSSIFKDHQDVRKSAEGKDAESTAVPVMGYTIGTLMRKTFKAFDPNATEEEKKGGHFILKVDIEGGEYPLLHQAVEDGTLCEFVKMGNKADIFIEFHSAKVTGKHDFVGKTKQIKAALTGCGVSMGNLGANWA